MHTVRLLGVKLGTVKYCPLTVSALRPVLPVCVSIAELQHVPDAQGPAVWVPGRVVPVVKLPNGVTGELSSNKSVGSNV